MTLAEMKTNNTEIISIVNHMVASVNDIFNKHDVSVYIMGSLARGGFSKIASDIDLGIILKGSLDGAKEKIEIGFFRTISAFFALKPPKSIKFLYYFELIPLDC